LLIHLDLSTLWVWRGFQHSVAATNFKIFMHIHGRQTVLFWKQVRLLIKLSLEKKKINLLAQKEVWATPTILYYQAYMNYKVLFNFLTKGSVTPLWQGFASLLHVTEQVLNHNWHFLGSW